MKKTNTHVVMKAILLLMLLGVSDSALAYDFELDMFYYTITSDSTVEVAGCDKNKLRSYIEYRNFDVKIPSSVALDDVKYAVTAIGDSAFYGICYGNNQRVFLNYTIPESVTSIGVAAFKNIWLERVTMLSEEPPVLNDSFDNPLVLCVKESVYDKYIAQYKGLNVFDYILCFDSPISSVPTFEVYTYGEDYVPDVDDGFYGGPEGAVLVFSYDKEDTDIFVSNRCEILESDEGYYEGYQKNPDYLHLYAYYTYHDWHFFEVNAFAAIDGKYYVDFCDWWALMNVGDRYDFEENGIYYWFDPIDFDYGYSCPSSRSVVVGFDGRIQSQLQWEPEYYSKSSYYSGDLVIPDTAHFAIWDFAVEEVVSLAFTGCQDLTSVTFPTTMKWIRTDFSDCPNLTKITCLGTVPPVIFWIDDEIYQNTTLYVPMSAIETYRNDEGWNKFQHIVGFYNLDYDFELDGLYYKKANDGEVVLTAGPEAYSGSLIVPNEVTYQGDTYAVVGIAASAFIDADLTNLVLPVTIRSIDASAFSNSHIHSLFITDSGEWAAGSLNLNVDNLMIGSGVTGLSGLQVDQSTIYSFGTIPPACDDQTFLDFDAELHVPASSLAAYFTAPYWCNFINIIGDAVELTELSLQSDSLSLLVGAQSTLTAALDPANAVPSEVTWSSSDVNVATVVNGVVTGVGAGECDIAAYCQDKRAVCHIKVTEILPTSLTLSQETAKVEVNSQFTLTATILPDDATLKTITWSTTNGAVATVDNGVVTAVGAGECDIIASCGQCQATCHVIVVEQFIYITLDEHDITMLPNRIITLTPTVSPVSTDLVVTSSNTSVAAARLANGKIQVVGVGEGSAMITVASADGYAESDSCRVTVYTEMGDVNCDGYVNITDVTLLIGYVMSDNVPANFSFENADVNRDDEVNITDVTRLISHLLSGAELEPKDPVIVPETFTVNGVSFNMVSVDGGTFTMGATAEQGSDANANEKPTHEVTLSSFSIGQTEVTQALWQAVMGSNPSHFSDDPNRPVECVSWDECQEFITRLNQMTGRRFRLPTEAEWEFAARGGSKSKGYKYAGSNDIDKVAWYRGNIPSQTSGTPGYGTQPVGTKSPNELALYDMSGNVWEWCQDIFGNYSSEAQTDPTGPETGTTRVVRGGCWYNTTAKTCRVTRRNGCQTTDNDNYLGLRLALDDNEVYTVNGVSFTMVPVKGGTFQMGATVEMDSDAYDMEQPVHQVTVSDYAIGQTEVTQALWMAVMGSSPSRFTKSPELPVERVTWEDCQTFITRLNELTGKQFRLPTEAEWEFAARGGNRSKGFKYSGSNNIDEVAWYYLSTTPGTSSNITSTQVVGSKMANELGIYDMSGNVWEWCQDYYGDYASEPINNPTGPNTGTDRIRRGGGWSSDGKACRNTHRSNRVPTYQYNSLGLRLAL